MVVLSEHGLYFFLNRSDKPRAIPFQKKVAGEILPAIRKTGRYEAPTEPPMAEAERLNSNDFNNIRRVLWLVTHQMRFGTVWTQAIWFYLRRALAVPSPQAFTVHHLPKLATELQNVVCAAEQVNNLVTHIEREAARRIFRKGESASVVVAELEALAHARLNKLGSDIGTLPNYLQADLASVAKRLPNHFGGHYPQAEQPDFFSHTATTTATPTGA